MFVSLEIDALTALGKASQLISTESKNKLKPTLNEDIRSLHENDHTTSDSLLGGNISGSLKNAKENYKLAQTWLMANLSQDINHWDKSERKPSVHQN